MRTCTTNLVVQPACRGWRALDLLTNLDPTHALLVSQTNHERTQLASVTLLLCQCHCLLLVLVVCTC